MTYKLTKTDGTLISLIEDFTTDTSTSLEIPGRGVSNYAGIIGDDLVSLLENFSSPTAPSNPIEGQIWYRTTNPNTTKFDGNLYVYNNGAWNSASKVLQSETIPDIAGSGTLWLMQPENMIWMYDSSITSPVPEFIRNDNTSLIGPWRLIGPQFSSECNTHVYEKKVLDTNGNYHSIIVTEVNGITNSIQSKDVFDLDTTKTGNLTDFVSLDLNGKQVSGFAPIYSGLNLNNTIDGLQGYFGGEAVLAKNLLNFDITDVIGRGNNLTLRPTFPINDKITDLGSDTNRWKTVYSDTIDASTSITISGSLAITENSLEVILSKDITLAGKSYFDTSGLVSLYRNSNTATDDILELNSDVQSVKSIVAKITSDGSTYISGGGHYYENGSRVIITNPQNVDQIDVLNIVADNINQYVRITDVTGNTWDLKSYQWTNETFVHQTDYNIEINKLETEKINRAGDSSITGILKSVLQNVATNGAINISPAYQTTTTNTLVEMYSQDHSTIGAGEQGVVHIDSTKYGDKYWYFDVSTGDIITPNGTVATTSYAQSLLPKGSIILWYGSASTIPANWSICDGTNGTPNMIGNTAVGTKSDNDIGESIGTEYASATTDEHILTIDEMPAHTHDYGYSWWSDSGSDTSHTIVSPLNGRYQTSSTGGNQGHSHGLTTVSTMQPSIKLYYIMKTS